MPLANFTRDKRFFEDLRDDSETMKSTDFDNQFNQVVDYINNSMITFINGLTGGAGGGVNGQANTFLRNIGDGSTEWAAINSDAFPDFSLEFAKIAQAASSCSILATGADQVFTTVSTNNDNEILISQAGDVPIWRKAQTTDIEDRTITGNQVGLQALSNEHLQPGILINNLVNNGLLNSNFVNNAFTTAKFALGQINSDSLGIIPLTGYDLTNKSFIALPNFKQGTITPNKVKNNSILPGHFNSTKFVTAGKFGPGAIVDSALPFSSSGTPSGDFNGFLTSAMLSPNFALTGRELELNTWIKQVFEPTAEAAFTAKGC